MPFLTPKDRQCFRHFFAWLIPDWTIEVCDRCRPCSHELPRRPFVEPYQLAEVVPADQSMVAIRNFTRKPVTVDIKTRVGRASVCVHRMISPPQNIHFVGPIRTRNPLRVMVRPRRKVTRFVERGTLVVEVRERVR